MLEFWWYSVRKIFTIPAQQISRAGVKMTMPEGDVIYGYRGIPLPVSGNVPEESVVRVWPIITRTPSSFGLYSELCPRAETDAEGKVLMNRKEAVTPSQRNRLSIDLSQLAEGGCTGAVAHNGIGFFYARKVVVSR